MQANIYELDLKGEVPSPVMIDGLSLERFTGLRILRLEDIQTYTVYRLASKLPLLHIFEARKIKGGGEIWDWRPFRQMTMLEELLLWRNETPSQAFNLTLDEPLIEIPDDVYPIGEHGSGGFVQLLHLSSGEEGQDDEITSSFGTPSSELSPSGPSRLLPSLKRLALVNIVSATMHRGTDSVMRTLVQHVKTFIYWNSFNILFPIVQTSFEQLEDLTLIEPSEPAWHDGTWQQHAAAFEGMRRLCSITLINSHMSRRFLIPVLEALLSLQRLKTIRLISTDGGMENVEMIFSHVLQSSWSGTLQIAIPDDLRDWSINARRRVQGHRSDTPSSPIMAGRASKLELKTVLIQPERDEDAGLKRLCLKAWLNSQQAP